MTLLKYIYSTTFLSIKKKGEKKNLGNPQFVVSLSNVIGLCRQH